MAERLIELADGFWNLRGSFKLAGGLIDVGTHSSLVRLASGRFVLLDAYTLKGPVKEQILGLTDGGRAIEAILHVHPFHTIHAKAVHEQLPHARLYGTRRHPRIWPDLPWEELHTEDPALHERFADDFDFTVPDGVDFIPENESLHFASVLVHHRASATLHVDDTLVYMDLPLMRGLRFHPTLKRVLEPVPGAAQRFRGWARELITRCAQVEHLATAHGAAPFRPRPGMTIAQEVEGALARVERVLSAHTRRFG